MGAAREAMHAQSPFMSRGNESRSQASSSRPNNSYGGSNGRSEDSWIEVASQPSSSSLSSGAPNDEIVTTGLRVQRQQQHRRRRRGSRRRFSPQDIDLSYQHQPSSGQDDEHEETESESDRALTSSNEDAAREPQRDVTLFPGTSSASEVALSSDEDDDNSTALGIGSNKTTTFTPQPNAFSHPPASRTSVRPGTVGNVSSRHDNRPGTRRNSRSSLHSIRRTRNQQQHQQQQQQQQQQHSPYNMISPSHQADNDAALRASLSTLLSCAAAARGLGKNDSQSTSAPAAPTTAAPVERNGGAQAEPSSFRLVPEAVAMGDEGGADTRRPDSPRFPRPPTAGTAPPRTRRKASPSKDRSGAQQPSAKRSRRTATRVSDSSSTTVGPTVMTWVISAGVVVLFSAISFSAGYVLGREVGRMEAGQGLYGVGGDGMSGVRGTANCGKDAVRGGLRRFRWIGGGTGSGISV